MDAIATHVHRGHVTEFRRDCRIDDHAKGPALDSCFMDAQSIEDVRDGLCGYVCVCVCVCGCMYVGRWSC